MNIKKDKDNLQFEQFIREWEEAAWKREAYCYGYTYVRTYPTLSFYQMQEVWGEDSKLKNNNTQYLSILTKTK